MSTDYADYAERLADLRRDKNTLAGELMNAGAQFNGNSVRCPYHGDQHNSGSMYQNEAGEWHYKCHACGKRGSVIDLRAERLNLDPNEVIRRLLGGNGKTKQEQAGETTGSRPSPPPPATGSPGKPSKPGNVKTKPASPGEGFETLDGLQKRVRGEIEAVYEYEPRNGEANLIVIRYRETPDTPKKFMQAKHKDGLFSFGAPEKPLPLYQLGKIRENEIVVVVEGEKCVHAINSLGVDGVMTATTSAGGANNEAGADWSILSWKTVVIWPDNDEPGKKYAERVIQILEDLPDPPQLILRIEPEGLGIPEKGDVVEFLADLQCAEDQKINYFMNAIDSATPRKRQTPASGVEERIQKIIRGEWVSLDFPNWSALGNLTNALLPETVTLLCGNPGATKSLFLMEALQGWHEQGIKTANFQLEENETYHLHRILSQRMGNNQILNTKWVRKNPTEAIQAGIQERDFLNEFGKTITVAKEEHPTLNDIADWIEGRAEAGCRIIAVDPISVAKKGRNSWLDDDAFMDRVLKIVGKHGASLILVTHPIKKRQSASGGLSDLSGGAAYERVAQCVLWIETHVPNKTVTIRGEIQDLLLEINRTVHIFKARNGIGGGARIGFNFSGSSLTLREEGIIRRENK